MQFTEVLENLEKSKTEAEYNDGVASIDDGLIVVVHRLFNLIDKQSGHINGHEEGIIPSLDSDR